MDFNAASEDFLEMNNRVAHPKEFTPERQANVNSLFKTAKADHQDTYRQIMRRVHSERVVPLLGWRMVVKGNESIRETLSLLEVKLKAKLCQEYFRLGLSHIDDLDLIALSTSGRSPLSSRHWKHSKRPFEDFQRELTTRLSACGWRIEFVGERKLDLDGSLFLWRPFR
jgi:hypothetical protein